VRSRAPRLAGLALGLHSVLLPAAMPAQAPDRSPSAEIQAAVADLDAGRLDDAERRLLAWIETHGDDPLALDLLGVAQVRAGRYDEAERHFLRSIEGDPGRVEPRGHLARLYLLQGRETEAVEQLRRAADAAEADASAGGLEKDLALELAVAELAAGRTGRAETQLRSVVERYDSAQALVLLARLQLSRGEPSEAMATAERARVLAPNAEAVLDLEARAAFDADELPRTLAILDALVRMHPEAPEYPYRLGLAQMREGDVRSAVETLLHARDLEPERVSIEVALGLALNVQNRYEEAKDAFEAALRSEPANALALGGLSEAWLGLDRLGDAERLALQALALDPAQPTAHLTLGGVRLKQERYEEARSALLTAAEGDPGNAKAHYQLSLAYARLGDTERSRAELARYRELRADEEGDGGGGMKP
jgi:tetratricopeptide (TPR) repeat protein